MNYAPRMKAGPLRNGAERGHGSIWHAVEETKHYGDAGPALCGARPAIMWSSWQRDGQQITCPRCLRLVAKMKEPTP